MNFFNSFFFLWDHLDPSAMQLIFFLQSKQNRNYDKILLDALDLSYKYELNFTMTTVMNIMSLFKRFLMNLSTTDKSEKEKLMNLEIKELLELLLLSSFKLHMASLFEEKLPNIKQLVRNGKILSSFPRRSEIFPLLDLVLSILTRKGRIIRYSNPSEDITGESERFARAIFFYDGKIIRWIKKRLHLF